MSLPWSVSEDAGATWSKPRVLLQRDGGAAIQHPLSPCPLYAVDEGHYIFFFHNHDGHFRKWGPNDTQFHRRPLYVAGAEFRPGADQPVWFSEPRLFMDNGGIPLGPGGRRDLAMYSSLTTRNGKRIFWYPDRKYFLLGRDIPDALLSDLRVPR